MQRGVIMTVLVLFAALSAAAIWQHGYTGIFAHQLQNLAGGQVLADLAIALSLAMIWIWRDAKETGRSAWPWIVATLIVGSFGPLVYLLTRKPNARAG